MVKTEENKTNPAGWCEMVTPAAVGLLVPALFGLGSG